MTQMNKYATAVSVLVCTLATSAALADPPISEAFYRLQSAEENEALALRGLRMSVLGTEQVEGRPLHWWEFTAIDLNGKRFGVRMLSERVPLRSACRFRISFARKWSLLRSAQRSRSCWNASPAGHPCGRGSLRRR